MKSIIFLSLLVACIKNYSVAECSIKSSVNKDNVNVIHFVNKHTVLSKMLKKDATRLAIQEEYQSLNAMGLCK